MDSGVQTLPQRVQKIQPQSEQNNDDESSNDELEQLKIKQHRIKKLALINKALIEQLKKQNQQLTVKISKHKVKIMGHNSMKKSDKEKQNQDSIKKQLSNVYKQIDLYKDTITNLKVKEEPIEHFEKIKQLQHKIKQQDKTIQYYQQEIKTIKDVGEKQKKDLDKYHNSEVELNIKQTQKEITQYKGKIKELRKAELKRHEVENKQHAYYVELESAIRRYAEKEKNKGNEEVSSEEEISEKEWERIKCQLKQLKKQHYENGKKIQLINWQKNKENKSCEENQLKLKEKIRKILSVTNRIAQLKKLTVIKQKQNLRKGNINLNDSIQLHSKEYENNDKILWEKVSESQHVREPKRWNIPNGFCIQKGKIEPDCNFFSDKDIVKPLRKSKVIEIHIWVSLDGVPSCMRFFYSNNTGMSVEGEEMIDNIPSGLQKNIFKLSKGDYLIYTKGKFNSGLLTQIEFISKFGNKVTFMDQNAVSGQQFLFRGKSNEIPSCFFGAYLETSTGEIRICHLGCELVPDW